MEPAKVSYGTRSDEKNQLKYEGGHTKWVQKKTRPVNKSPGSFADIHSKKERKKDKKIEDQRLNEDGAAIAEAVALHVLLDEDLDDEDNIVLKKDEGLESGDSKFALLQFSLEELGWDSDVDGHWLTWSNSESCDWNVSSDLLGRDLQPQFFEEEATDSIISDKVVAEKDISSLQIGDDMQADTNVLLDGTGKVKFQKELDEDQALSPLIENFVNPTPLQEVQDKSQKKRTVPQRQISQPQRGGNTRFFHSPKLSNSRRNAINRMKDRQIHGRKKKGEKLRAYFQNMFASANPDPPSELEELISPVVTMEENEALCSIPTALEIKEVVNKMDSWKFPGPDGRPAFIYKAHWDDTIGQTLVETVQRFFSTGHLLEEMNAAYLIFIPKNNKHSPFEDRENFRPLTICNVAYKVISKIMNNRLRPLLDKIITPLQSAFVPNRSISDEATIVSEMVNYMIKKKGNKVYMGLKLKMEDAYHLTEWPFLFEVMRKHGFSEKWLLLVKQCISTASLSILINGVTYGNIILKRGLREGDPISPSLFIIAADVLSRLIIREEHNGTFHGTKVSRTSPHISHLMNRETLLVFGRAELMDVECLRACLQKYSEWSGHMVNFEKSTIFFSKNISKKDAKQLMETFNVSNFCNKAKDFGLPSHKSVAKDQVFDEVVKNLQTRLGCWKARSLPWMGANIRLKGDTEAEASKCEADDIGRSGFVVYASLVKGDNEEAEWDKGESKKTAHNDFVANASLVEDDNEGEADKIDNSGCVANDSLLKGDGQDSRTLTFDLELVIELEEAVDIA